MDQQVLHIVWPFLHDASGFYILHHGQIFSPLPPHLQHGRLSVVTKRAEAIIKQGRYYTCALLVYLRYSQQECTASSPTSQAIPRPIWSFSTRQDVQ